MGVDDKSSWLFVGGRIRFWLFVSMDNLLSTAVRIRWRSLSKSLVTRGPDEWSEVTATLVAGVVALVERDMALSLKFEFVSCSRAACDVAVVDWRDNKWLVRRDEMRLMSASSSLLFDGNDERGDEMNGCCLSTFVGVSKSMFTGSDWGGENADVGEGSSRLKPSPAVESGRLFAYGREQEEEARYWSMKLFSFFSDCAMDLKRNRTSDREN